ncbi:MAG: outer membrane beta-barrel family protein [Muribaculaceae bacterium]|nr:outer membrane beta-barrel family protein [Muribaculaceae bacterium]
MITNFERLAYRAARFIVILSLLCVATEAQCGDKIYLRGKVKESLGKHDLTNAYVLLYDSNGNVTDSIRTNMGRKWDRGQGVVETSAFAFQVPRVDSVYVFDVVCDRYQTKTVTYTVSNVGKREEGREIPIIFLERASHKLKEVTVTTSKIKFYNKGDTVVYNADAFQLAEGSMLDALISQLPGVELTNDGQIKVNGEFVESLLLNGKDFFDGDKNLMLENIGAYTVKDIQVYKGDTKDVKRGLALAQPKVLTMDVRLKREFMGGLIVNGQAGYGSADRYMGRLYASWYTGTTSVTLVGNANNLNDSRAPGRNDTWTPDQMPTGRRDFGMGAVNYSYESPDEKTNAEGSVTFNYGCNNVNTTVGQTNFLPGGDTYENAYGRGRSRDIFVAANNYFYRRWNSIGTTNSVRGVYRNSHNSSTNLSGSFNTEQTDMTMSMLDAIYSDGSPESLQSLINRSKTMRDSRVRMFKGDISQSAMYALPKSSSRFIMRVGAEYMSEKNNVWDDYDIRYGLDAANSTRRRQYTDNTPNHDLSFSGNLGYHTQINRAYFGLMYDYMFMDQTRDSYMFALDRIADMGVYGELPDGYLECFVPEWSNTSRTISNRHSISPSLNYHNTLNGNLLWVMLYPNLSFNHRHFSYQRAGREYPLSVSNTYMSISSQAELSFDGEGDDNQRKYRHKLNYRFSMSSSLPELVDMIDIINDADPLNVYLGNPDLKTAYSFTNELKWTLTPRTKQQLTNTVTLNFTNSINDITRGYSYDMETGVRTNRTYNTSGNWNASLRNDLNWQFGSKKQFTLTSATYGTLSRYGDMVGVNGNLPQLRHVDFRSISQKMTLAWHVGEQTLTLRADYTRRNTTSREAGFNTINADIFNYGLSGVFKLPEGFGISTDFVCYTRSGYGMSELDTTDPVWNARLSYTPMRHTRWTFMLDAFDMLHTLTNVHYAVSATGRTVSWSNTLPRYVLLSVQFRFNKQPKK